jgi:hypothetical protein
MENGISLWYFNQTIFEGVISLVNLANFIKIRVGEKKHIGLFVSSTEHFFYLTNYSRKQHGTWLLCSYY